MGLLTQDMNVMMQIKLTQMGVLIHVELSLGIIVKMNLLYVTHFAGTIKLHQMKIVMMGLMMEMDVS